MQPIEQHGLEVTGAQPISLCQQDEKCQSATNHCIRGQDTPGHTRRDSQLLSVVASVSHEGTHKALNDGAVSLAEALLLPPSSGVRHEDSVLVVRTDVINQGVVADVDISEVPAA